jgi:hypothetical protein
MLRVNQLVGFGAGGAVPHASKTFTLLEYSGGDTTSASATGDLSVRTGEWVVTIAAQKGTSGNAANVTGVTLNGVSLTVVIDHKNSRTYTGIWRSSSPISTDGTDEVIVTWASVEHNQIAMGCYAVDGIISMTPTASVELSGGAPAVLDLNVEAGGLLFGVTYNRGAGTPTWAGSDSDPNGDFQDTANTWRRGGASNAFATAQTPASFDCISSTVEKTSCAASFR